MKRFIALLLATVIIFSLVGCGGEKSETSTPESPPDAATLDEELLRAISYGFVTDDELTDLSRTITYAEFCAMLTKVVAMRGEQYVPEWESLAVTALQSDEPMQQDDALLAMFEASVVMGIDREQVVMEDWEGRSTAADWWEGISRDYTLFPNWEEPYADSYDGNLNYDMSYHAAWHFEKVPSTVSGLLPFEPNEKMTYDFSKDVSFEDAVRALTRLIESNAKITEEEPVYISLDEIGTYDAEIITEELLGRIDAFPAVSHAELPSEWKGCGLSCCKDGRHIYRDFRESDIAFLAENGFNFTRLFFGFDTLRFPDYPEDGRLVNENELKELDQLIAWGMEHGVHIQISMDFYLDENGNCKREDNSDHMMPENDAQWEIVSDYWTMLALRYAGIPNEFLTFDLCNEIQPEDWEFSYSAEKLGEMVSAIRSADSERVLLYSFSGEPRADWLEVTASLGLSIGCHPYYPRNISTGDGGAGSGTYFEPCWPMPVLPVWEISVRNEPLTLQGDLGGAGISIHVGKSGPNAKLEIYADGVLIETLSVPGGEPDENGECWYGEEMLTASLPDGTKEAKIWVREEDAHIDTVIVESAVGRTMIVPSSDAEDHNTAPLPIAIAADGSYANTENTVVSNEEIYRRAIEPYQEIAERYGVGFMIGEFGVFAHADWDIALVTAYQESMMDLFAEKELGWCFCELYNSGGHLLLREPVEPQWENATTKPVDLGYHDGASRVVVEMLDSFRKYTMR